MDREPASGGEPADWRENLQLDIVSIDEEHRLLFALARALHADRVHELLADLHEYVRLHFQREQGLMKQSLYPHMHAHVLEHQDLAHRVALWQLRAGPWTQAQVQDFRRFLLDWLGAHIQAHDLPFARWYRAHLHAREDQPGLAGA